MRMFLAAIALAVTLNACVGVGFGIKPLSPEQQLAGAEATFTLLVDQVTQARIDGVISDKSAWICVQQVIRTTSSLFDVARVSLTNGTSIAMFLGQAQANVRNLRRARATGENICEHSSSNLDSHRRSSVGASTGLRVQRNRSDYEYRRAYGAYSRRVGSYHSAA